MELKKYLELRELTVTEAARQLSIRREWLSQVIHGKRMAGRVLAQKIITWSEGAVNFKDLWGKE